MELLRSAGTAQGSSSAPQRALWGYLSRGRGMAGTADPADCSSVTPQQPGARVCSSESWGCRRKGRLSGLQQFCRLKSLLHVMHPGCRWEGESCCTPAVGVGWGGRAASWLSGAGGSCTPTVGSRAQLPDSAWVALQLLLYLLNCSPFQFSSSSTRGATD